jgi:hypothetical protein
LKKSIFLLYLRRARVDHGKQMNNIRANGFIERSSATDTLEDEDAVDLSPAKRTKMDTSDPYKVTKLT